MTGQSSLTVVGPIPPPTTGQSVVTDRMLVEFNKNFSCVRVVNTSVGMAPNWMRPLKKLWDTVVGIWRVLDAKVVYISLNVGPGIWLSSVVAGFARVSGAGIFLHHHSYAYVRERKLGMVALTKVAGPAAYHIVLSETMANDLGKAMPELQRMLIVDNAGVIDPRLLELPLKCGGPVVLGHLCNLTVEKGLVEVVDLALALQRSGTAVRLIVGGPAVDTGARAELDRARSQLGSSFEYRGPLAGSSKVEFFDEITHFAFPTKYRNEALPLVLYEALAAGVVCMATRQGSIVEQLEGSAGVVADTAESFVDEACQALVGASVSEDSSAKARSRYLGAADKSASQIQILLSRMRDPR